MLVKDHNNAICFNCVEQFKNARLEQLANIPQGSPTPGEPIEDSTEAGEKPLDADLIDN